MSEIARKVLSEGTMPIMSDEGILQVFKYYYERVKNNQALVDGGPGVSRILRMSESKERIDNPDYTKQDLVNLVNKEFQRRYGTAKTINFNEDFPFGYYNPSEVSSGNNYDNRIYINAPFGPERCQFILLFVSKCKERGIHCGAKFFEKEADSTAVDNMVLYPIHENINDYIEILEEIKVELPTFVENCGSPIASAMNTSYYSLAHFGDKGATYNYWFNRLSSKAFYVAMSKLISNNSDFYNSLDEREKTVLDMMSNDELLKQSINNSKNMRIQPELSGFNLGAGNAVLFKSLVERFIASSLEISTEQIIETLRDSITDITSLANFGDLEHKDMPISLRESDFAALGLNANDLKSLKPNDEKKETLAIKEKPIKKLYPKERVKEIFNADERQIRVEAMQAGYTFADTEGKTEQELRTMIFDRITLDNESMISILCGGDYQLKSVLVGYGTAPKEVADKSREELERMYIEKVGLDEIITAREEVIKQDEISGEKRTHWYENTLQAMRMERGKNIMESEEFKSLKTKEEKRAFLDKLSVTELEDAERYYTNHRNAQRLAEESAHAM